MYDIWSKAFIGLDHDNLYAISWYGTLSPWMGDYMHIWCKTTLARVWSHQLHHLTTPDYVHLHLHQGMINVSSPLSHCPSWEFLTMTQPFGKCFEGRAPPEPCSSVPGRFLRKVLEIFVEDTFWKFLAMLPVKRPIVKLKRHISNLYFCTTPLLFTSE